MKVAMVHLTSGGFSGGYRKYAEMMTPMLRQHPDVGSVEVFVPQGAGADGESFRDPRDLRRQLAALMPDIIFIPTARWIDCGDIPTVVMVRNMEPLEFPSAANPL